ncbi:peptidase S8/S53 domain-containing protein [Haematococcus lacustris]
MRTALGDSVAYFERDLAASTTQIFATTLDATYNVRYWNLDRLDQVGLPLDGVYNPGSLDGSGSHVFVLDTGIRWSHQDFSNRVGTGTSIIGSSNWDDNGHGTHVAGIAAGSIHGVAKKAIVHAVKVLDAQGSGSYSNIISGMGWVKNFVLQNNIRQAVVVMSLGGPRASSLNDAVEDLAANGIQVVVAAGNNNGGDSCSYSPASATSAITVGASDNNDRLTSFSNVGGCISIFAPGASIQSASYGSDTGEATMSGTSMAGPHVAGVVAMILQNQPGASVSDVRSALNRAAPAITFSPSSPSRLLNAQTSRLRSGQSSPTPVPAPTSTPSTAPRASPPPVATPTPVVTAPISAPAFQPISFPSFGAPSGRPSWCATCAWCMFCN